MQARYTVLVVFMDDYPVCFHNRYGSLGFSWLRVLWNVDHRTDILSCIVVVVTGVVGGRILQRESFMCV